MKQPVVGRQTIPIRAFTRVPPQSWFPIVYDCGGGAELPPPPIVDFPFCGGRPQCGGAFDIAMANHDPVAFEAAARAVGFKGFGFYPRSGFIHVDLGPARVWGERFPARAVPFSVEAPPVREVLAESRTLRGAGAAGVATMGAAGVEVMQEVLAEAQGAILPLVPYLDTLRWVFIVLALAGVAVTLWARVDDWRRGRR